jgi:Ala-tRNA(Pro) deacylase
MAPPHLSARGTLTLLNNALLSTHLKLPTTLPGANVSFFHALYDNLFNVQGERSTPISIPTRLKSLLDENQIPYSVMTHTTAYTAQGAAAVMQISGKELAKTVVLWVGEEMSLAVLPAPNHVRLDKLADELGKSVRLATEQEFSDRFPDCELGAMPPFGSLYNLPVYVDESLAADEAIVFNAGTHRDAIRMRFDDFVRMTKPKVCSFARKA